MGLTCHREGSIKELWSIALPLMLSSLAVMSMLFVDRLMLAKFSPHALTAAVNASTTGWIFLFGGMVLTSISEVFVAQYNGAGNRGKLGEPVWQMIWASLFSIPFFLLICRFGGDFFFGDGRGAEKSYLWWMMLFSPAFVAYSALCGFFVGQGKTMLITALAIASNGVNAILDYLLIFGWKGIFPSLGVEGAAIATSCSSVFQAGVLLFFFLRKDNREQCGTANWKFNPTSFGQCFKVGAPAAIFAAIEILGWAIFYQMMTAVSEGHIVVTGVCQSVAILFYFFSEGISKAAGTITGNLIGAKNAAAVNGVFRSGMILHTFFFVTLLTLLYFYSSTIVQLFLDGENAVNEETYNALTPCLYIMTIYLFFEGMRLLLAGILTAATDTLFLLVGGTASVWLLLVAPVWFFVVVSKGSVIAACSWWIFYNASASLLYYLRYSQGKWRLAQLSTG